MGSSNYPVYNSGIYRNLPQFDPAIRGLQALITGANGISGFATLRVLLQSPQRWEKIYTLSRRPVPAEMLKLIPADLHSRIHHVGCNLQSTPEEIAEQLKKSGVGDIDYIFYYAYLQPKAQPGATPWSNDQELVDVNAGMLSSFLRALPIAGIQPTRFLLQTGAKHYGGHIGRTRNPCLESDPRPDHLGPNFYYAQEDLLFDYCTKSGVKWNVIRPPWIIGATTSAQMNAFYSFAVYAAVTAERGLPLLFHGSWSTWQERCGHHGTAMLTSFLSEWAVLEPECENQAFNSQDTSPISWDRFFEELARWYNVKEGSRPPAIDETGMLEGWIGSGKNSPMADAPPQVTKMAFRIQDWAQDPANAKTWKTIMERETLIFDPFEDIDANFPFADATLFPATQSMNKARRLGWTGFVDTMESIFEMYNDMALLRMLPEMKVDTPRPLI